MDLQRVSVSLRSYIHSYGREYFLLMKRHSVKGFRLLTELYSFLLIYINLLYTSSSSLVSVSLRSYIHSYTSAKCYYGRFCNRSFRLLTELYSFLPYGQKSLLLQYFFRVLSCDIFIFEIFLSISVKSILNSLFFEYRLTNIFL